MSSLIDLKGLDKAAVLAALYNAAKPQGMGFLHYDPKPMDVEEAKEILSRGCFDFDYLKGRVMKVDLSGETLDPRLYDRDNGEGAAQQAIDSLRTTQDPDNILIRAHHVDETRKSASKTSSLLSEETTISEEDGTAIITLGLSGVADVLKPKIDEAEQSLESPLE